jgi:hypothetical protein
MCQPDQVNSYRYFWTFLNHVYQFTLRHHRSSHPHDFCSISTCRTSLRIIHQQASVLLIINAQTRIFLRAISRKKHSNPTKIIIFLMIFSYLSNFRTGTRTHHPSIFSSLSRTTKTRPWPRLGPSRAATGPRAAVAGALYEGGAAQVSRAARRGPGLSVPWTETGDVKGWGAEGLAEKSHHPQPTGWFCCTLW